MKPSPRLSAGGFPDDQGAGVPFLRVYRFGRFFRSFKLQPGNCVIGRDPDATLQLNVSYVSRQHCRVEFEGENRLFLQDLGSSNGTFVNGQRITRCNLAHGDEIRIGEIQIKISHPSFAPAKVIPFPNVPTDPEIVLPEPASPPAHIDLRPPVAPPRPVAIPVPPARKSEFKTVVASVIVAALLAWGANAWRNRRPSPEVTNGPPVRVTPADVAVPDRTSPVVRKSVPKPDRTRPSSIVMKPPAKVEEVPTADDLVASLDRSLGGLDATDDLENAGRLKPSTTTSGVAPKVFESRAGSVEVAIEMPKTNELPAPSAGKKKSEVVDLKTYQTALRERIQGVETCFARNVKEGTPGRLSIWFSIGSSGKVSKSGVASSTYKNKGFHACVLEKISVVNAGPPPWAGFTATYTFNFGAQRVQF